MTYVFLSLENQIVISYAETIKLKYFLYHVFPVFIEETRNRVYFGSIVYSRVTTSLSYHSSQRTATIPGDYRWERMFKRFNVEEHVSSTSQIKNSVQRSIVNQISEQYPLLVEIIDVILPKKSMLIAKAQDNIQLVVVNNEIIFYNQMNGPFYPTLKLLHKYPTMMPRMQCDKGAIKFVLGGANIMCPGFTSAGGFIAGNVVEEMPVAIYAEGKEHALAIGLTKMSRENIYSVNKGIAVETVHYLMDGLWLTTSVQ